MCLGFTRGRLGGCALLPPRTPVGTPDGLSFIPGPDLGGGMELVAQAHGGALLSGGKPGNAGGRRFAERQAQRRERTDAIKDAVTGHIERYRRSSAS